MGKLKLFIWEGDGISDAYHDDGTLVILAETPEQARQIVRDAKAASEKAAQVIEEKAKELGYSEPYYWRRADSTAFQKFYYDAHAKYPHVPGGEWDGSDSALDREPDKIIEADKPAFVVFNGGGYD